MSIEIELLAAVAPGSTKPLATLGPDGSMSSFVIPPGQSFVATDISVSRLSVLPTPVLVALDVEQSVGTGTVARWQFVGQITQNIERAFTTGIRFSTPFRVNLLSSSGDSFNVRIHGFFA
jgi:hypothetical protein